MTYFTIIRILSVALFIHNINADTFQAQNINPRSESLLNSIQYELKDPLYRQKILPNNFNHLSNLIVTGTNANQPPAYLQSVIKLFSNLLKGSDYVNASALEQFMETFPTISQPYFNLTASHSYITNGALYDAHMFDRFKQVTNTILYVKFSSEYNSFKQNPTQFLENISGEILTIAQEEITRENLRHTIVRFMETTLNKLLWNTNQPEKSWHQVKHIADQLASLIDNGIIDDVNDLDDMYWSLLTRYCYFIELTAIDNAPSFYSFIKHDIATSHTLLLELPEQDTFIESKLSYILRTLTSAEAQSRMHHSSEQ